MRFYTKGGLPALLQRNCFLGSEYKNWDCVEFYHLVNSVGLQLITDTFQLERMSDSLVMWMNVFCVPHTCGKKVNDNDMQILLLELICTACTLKVWLARNFKWIYDKLGLVFIARG